MAAAELHSGPLLLQPPELEKWRENQSDYAIAYDKVLAAEDRATQQGTNADIVHARLAGHLLLELFRMRDNFGDTACSQLAKELLSQPRPPRDDIDNVIALGEWYKDYFVRLCTFDSFLMPPRHVSLPLKSGHAPGRIPYPPHTLHALPSTHWQT